mgnify:CR=1 FL=1
MDSRAYRLNLSGKTVYEVDIGTTQQEKIPHQRVPIASISILAFIGNAETWTVDLAGRLSSKYDINSGYIIGPNANLTGADLTGADLTGVLLDTTILDCKNHSICE